MISESKRWVVILASAAGGSADDRRPGPRSQSSAGVRDCEKLSRVIARGQAVAGRDRCVVVVPASQRKKLHDSLAGVANENLFFQPCDRGSACSLLWPLIHIGCDDPEATVVVLPADREDADTVAFARSLEVAMDHSRRDLGKLMVLAPVARGASRVVSVSTASRRTGGNVREVMAVDSPDGALEAREIVRAAGLWGNVAFTARASTLLGLFEGSLPWLVRMFHYWLVHPKPEMESKLVEHLFRILPHVDLVEQVLSSAERETRVISIPRCECSDLGVSSPTPRCRLRHAGCGLAAAAATAPQARPSAG